jgi:hypothetical protein
VCRRPISGNADIGWASQNVRQCIKGLIIMTNLYANSLLPILVVGLAIVLSSLGTLSPNTKTRPGPVSHSGQ